MAITDAKWTITKNYGQLKTITGTYQQLRTITDNYGQLRSIMGNKTILDNYEQY